MFYRLSRANSNLFLPALTSHPVLVLLPAVPPSSPPLISPGSSTMPGQAKHILRFKKLTENAFAPCKGSKWAAGYDLCSFFVCGQELSDTERGRVVTIAGQRHSARPGVEGARMKPRQSPALSRHQMAEGRLASTELLHSFVLRCSGQRGLPVVGVKSRSPAINDYPHQTPGYSLKVHYYDKPALTLG
ncbi:hypothetical protein E2C01_035628 [Portunus trituberculatus]|uniref:Uncharacterized protein n=1 Tax=Portunus trituberculatus TaxID=210409 RepID=A0A5B7F9P0_PORTR|nr:hypothetical protein [Portunus trituberculatus]